MPKLINKFYGRIIIAIILGFLFAGEVTYLIYSPCLPSDNPGVPYNAPPDEDSLTRCAEITKAINKPNDLLYNKHDSLNHFSENFAQGTVVSFAILSVYSLYQTKKKT
jgi:hypothetical protein